MFEDILRQRAVQLKQIADDLNTKGEDNASPSLFDQEDSEDFTPEAIEKALREDMQTLDNQMQERWSFFNPRFFSSQDINL